MTIKPRSSDVCDLQNSASFHTRLADIRIVAIAFIGSFSFWPALIALSTLFDTFEAQFGWSRSQVSTAQLIFTIASVAGAPVIGPLIDRFGVRPLLLSGLACVAIPIALVAEVRSYGEWIVVWTIASIFGQLVAPPVWAAGVARQFERHRGLALGIAACGFAASAAITPLIVVRLDAQGAWSSFYYGMAGFLIVVLLPLTFAGFRERRSAGALVSSVAAAENESGHQGGNFASDVLLTRRFLMFGATIGLVSFVVGGMLIHLQPMFRAQGLSAVAAASAFAFYGAGGIVGRLCGGWLLDRFDKGPTPALPMCILPAIAAALAMVTDGAGMTLYACIAFFVGVAAGVEVDVVPYLARRFFPAKYFGRSYISLAAIFVAGSGISPFVVSGLYDALHSYAYFLIASIALGGLAGILLLSMGRYPLSGGQS